MKVSKTINPALSEFRKMLAVNYFQKLSKVES